MGTVWYMVVPLRADGGRWIPSALLVGFPLLAVLFYLALGRPDMPDAPLAARLAGPVENLPPDAVRARLEAELRARPNDAQGWRLLARLRQGVGDHAKAADAWQRLIALGETDAEALTGLAVALIEQDGGVVSSAAFELLERVRAAEPENLQAGFWYAIALRQQGAIEEARAAFVALRAAIPDGVPLAAMLEREIEALNSAATSDAP
jgi:cytochrome c-type biogenesis protein CcmH